MCCIQLVAAFFFFVVAASEATKLLLSLRSLKGDAIRDMLYEYLDKFLPIFFYGSEPDLLVLSVVHVVIHGKKIDC